MIKSHCVQKVFSTTLIHLCINSGFEMSVILSIMSLDARSQCFEKVLVTFTADKDSLRSQDPGELIVFKHQ